MATSLDTLVKRTRRFLRDWPQEDILTASVTDSSTTLTVADGTLYADNWLIEIDQETLFVNGNGTGTSVTVRRGARGSTAATHANGSTVLLRPTFSYLEIVDAINQAKDDCYPLIYRPVSLEYTGILAETYEYNVPTMTGLTIPIPYLSSLEMKESGDLEFYPFRGWTIRRGATPFFKFRFTPVAGSTLRINGYGPFPDLATGDSLTADWPVHADKLLPLGAAAHLLAGRESDRATGRGMQDDVVEWSRLQGPGAAISAADRLYQRFQRQLVNSAMSPMPPHVVPTF